jgi:sirohydrochlorin ferrochelatase
MNTRTGTIAVALSLVSLVESPRLATSQSVGTIVVAHGGDSAWNALVRKGVSDAKVAGPIEVSFLMGPEAALTRFQDVVEKLVSRGVREVVAVPLLVSSHSGHYEQIRYLARLTDTLDAVMHEHLHHGGIERPRADVPIRVTAAIDDSHELARVLTDRAKESQPDARGRALMLVGHGPNSAEDYAAWMKNLRVVADSVRRWSGFRDVRVELVREDAPAPVRAEAVQRLRELIGMQAEITDGPVTVIPILVSRGGISRSRIMQDLQGLPIRYAGDPLMPHPAMAEWITRRITSR